MTITRRVLALAALPAAVLPAAALFGDAAADGVYAGNPAVFVKERQLRVSAPEQS